MCATSLPSAERERITTLCECGARSAADALSLFLGEPVARVTRARAGARPYGELAASFAEEGGRALSVGFSIAGAIRGRLAVLVEEGDVARFVAPFVPAGTEVGFDARCRSAFCEVGNIIASAFLNSLASSLRTSCVPSVPSLVCERTADALETALATAAAGDEAGRLAWALATDLEREGARFSLRLVLLPSRASLEALVAAGVP